MEQNNNAQFSMAMHDTPTIHLIGNAHLDPVWLWDWREGMNEGLTTCRTLVDLMREDSALSIIRGEAAIYEYIERHDPKLFKDITRLVKAGRWDVVGGNYIQPDTNMPATEPMLRQFIRGKTYFREKFGLEVTAAWAADSFGHSAGLPEILAAAGFEAIAFTRPTAEAFPLAKPAFWWRATSGARILCYRPVVPTYYCIARDKMEKRLDEALAEIRASMLQNVACFYGLGNHGGGPTRVHLRHITEWAARHPEVRVVHSGLHRLFAALKAEAAEHETDYLPTVAGELNFCLRGCSASMAKFKFLYRRAEVQITRAERVATAVAAFCKTQPPSLARPWDALLFNAFHDILPGTSIERGFDDQIAETGGALNAAQHMETDALLDLAQRIDTTASGWTTKEDEPRPVPIMVWNPHPRPLKTQVEIEVSLDYRPLEGHSNDPDTVPVAIRDASGKRLTHQIIREEHDSMRKLAWRRRAVVPLELPPFGWRIVHMGMQTGKPAKPGRSVVKKVNDHTITNGKLTIDARVGSTAVKFLRNGRPWLADGLQVVLFEDPWGAWGGMFEESDSWNIDKVSQRWKIARVQVLESGPERAALWVRFAGKNSRIDLTFQLMRDAQHATVLARALWNETSKRLKLVLPTGGAATYDVPGGTVRREPCGEVAGGRWVRAGRGAKAVGFASDALYGFATTDREFHATVLRSCRYASDVVRRADEAPWMPPIDAGEHRFRFLLTPQLTRLPQLAAELEDQPIVLPVPPRTGKLPANGSLLQVLSPECKLLALTPDPEGGTRLRLQNISASAIEATAEWLGTTVKLGPMLSGEIATWRLGRSRGVSKAIRTPATA